MPPQHEFTVNFPQYTPLFAESNIKVRETMERIVNSFIERAENAYKAAAEKDDDPMYKQLLHFPSDTLRQMVGSFDFRRYDGFNEQYEGQFRQFAEEETQKLVASGKTQDEAYEIADRHLEIRQKKFIEFVLNEEYSMYNKIHETFKPAMAAIEEFEKYAFENAPKPETTATSIVDEFRTAYLTLSMDYSAIQASFYPLPRLVIEDQLKQKCKIV